MEANDAGEMMDAERTRDTFKQRAAIAIAIFAMILAICSLGGSNAGKEALNNNVLASNHFNFFQAKNMRQTAVQLAADELELGWLNAPGLPDATREAMRQRLEQYRKTIDRYESEPETREGKKELIVRAREHEEKRDHALKQDPYFDYAEALLQIAIVLISVSIIASLPWLAFFGGAIGVVGFLLTINGFLLLVRLPFLG
jgi:hypothetical protein